MASDEALLDAWRQGDRAAGGELFERHFDAIARFFANKAGAEIDDLVQRTFEGCVKAKERFRGDASFRTFLFSVARNVMREHIRERVRQRERFDALECSVHDVGLSPSRLASGKHEQKLVLTALRHLPLEQQTLLELYFWEELTAPALSAILEIPEGTVRSRIRLARKALEKVLGELEQDDALLKSTVSGLEDWARSLRALADADRKAE